MMFNFSAILTDLQAAIAAAAARERTMTALLLAVWGRIARMRSRLERLVAQWRAGTLPKPQAPRTKRAGQSIGKPRYPVARAWLVGKLGHNVVAYGLQLQHLLSDAECAAFLAAVPQAGRILRPLLHMLGVSPLPDAVRRPPPAAPAAPAAGPMPMEIIRASIAGRQFSAA